MNKKISTPIALGIILILAILVGGYAIWQYLEIQTEKSEIPEIKIPEKEETLQQDIKDGKSIMFVAMHPDDAELLTPGLFAFACGDKDNDCYIISVVSAHDINLELGIKERQEAINWFKETYLKDYSFLDAHRPFNQQDIKTKLIAKIEEIKPDIILTFSPYGWWGHPEHSAISKSVIEIYDKLSYKPKIYYIINMDQSIPVKEHYEYKKYPPTDIINLDIYSDKLGKTLWEAKIESWKYYASSVPDIQKLLDSPERLQKNDKKEYFTKVEL